jgi:hypothetical protein
MCGSPASIGNNLGSREGGGMDSDGSAGKNEC